MKIAMIVAMAENNAIGINNKMPWYLPGDLRYFKAVTMGKPIIMGRKTFESLRKPLPGRTNIVITRDPSWKREGVTIVNTLKAAFDTAKDVAFINGAKEIMVIGGAQIYQQALPFAHKIYLTRVHKSFEADTFFPDIDKQQWNETFIEKHETEGCETLKYAYTVLERIGIS